MKEHILIFLHLMLCILPATAQQTENMGYVLSIKETKPISHEGRVLYDIPAELHNTTKDTLYYLSMSCSWQMFYQVDNPGFEVEGEPCDKNVPEVVSIAPGKSNTVNLRLVLTKSEDYNPESLRIGLNLIKLNGKKITEPFRELRKIKNIIWSNTVMLPAD